MCGGGEEFGKNKDKQNRVTRLPVFPSPKKKAHFLKVLCHSSV